MSYTFNEKGGALTGDLVNRPSVSNQALTFNTDISDSEIIYQFNLTATVSGEVANIYKPIKIIVGCYGEQTMTGTVVIPSNDAII